jgi:hypothetical protein
MKFELLEGTHREGNKKYTAKGNNIITSGSDLVTAFPNKFRRRADLERRGENPPPSPAIVNEGNEKKPRARAEAAKQREEAERTQEERDEEGEVEKNEVGETEAPEGETETPVKPAKVKVTPHAFGDDVSADFPTAKEADFLVFKDKHGYHVVDPSDMKKPLNAKPLKKAGAVTEFIGEFLKKT